MTHTPAPWSILRMNAKDGFLVIGTVGPFGPTRHIAELSWPKTDDAAFADARLIAAAPDLLAALKALLPNIPVAAEDADFMAPMMEQARAAIARATPGISGKDGE